MPDTRLAVIVGANRGLGLGLTGELLSRGYEVIATARDLAKAQALEKLAKQFGDRLRRMRLDLNDQGLADAFAGQVGHAKLDLLFLNAGVAGPADRTAQDVTIAETGALFYTNAVAPVRLARTLMDRMREPDAVIAFMTSIMGSVALNTEGGAELYRASKAALNSLTRSFAAGLRGRPIAVLSFHPGWVRTDMGGEHAPLDVETSVRGIADVLERERGRPGHRFLDYTGHELPW